MNFSALPEGLPAGVSKSPIGARAARMAGHCGFPSRAAASNGRRLELQFILGGSVGGKKVYTFTRGKANNLILDEG